MHYGPNFLFCCLIPDSHSSWECWTLSGFNYCLACFYALIEHKQGSKFVSYFIADFNVLYQELEQNTPTVNMDICHICVILYMLCSFLQMLH